LDLDKIIYPQFETAAGRSTLFELKFRLLANKTKELSDVAEAFKFNDTFQRTMEFFKTNLSQQDIETLELAKKIRNKIVHGDFKAAFNILKPAPSGARVLQDIENVSGEELLGKLFEMAEGKGNSTTIPEAEKPGMFGWLLEASMGNLFQKSIDLNNAAITIVDRIALDAALEGIDDPKIRERLRPK